MKNIKNVWAYTLSTCNSTDGIEVLYVSMFSAPKSNAKKEAEQNALDATMGPYYAEKARQIRDVTGGYEYFHSFYSKKLVLKFQRNKGSQYSNGKEWYGGRVDSCDIGKEVAKALMTLSDVNLDNPKACLDALKAIPVEYLSEASEYIPASNDTLKSDEEILNRGKESI